MPSGILKKRQVVSDFVVQGLQRATQPALIYQIPQVVIHQVLSQPLEVN